MTDQGLKNKLMDARCRIQITDIWYGAFCARFDWQEDEKIQTMGVTFKSGGRVLCKYAPSWCNELTIENLTAVIKHEIEHIVRLHLKRFVGTKEDHFLYNIAADWVINGPKLKPNIKNLPECGEFLPHPEHSPKELLERWGNVDLSFFKNEGLTTEDIFKWLKKHTKVVPLHGQGNQGQGNQGQGNQGQGNQGQNGQGQGQGNQDRAIIVKNNGNIIHISLHDDHDCWDESEATNDEMRQAAADMVRSASKTAGKEPGHLTSQIKKLQESEVPWYHVLANITGRVLGRKRRTFSRIKRKNPKFGVKGTSSHGSTELTVMVDTSGSMSDQMIEKCFNEIEGMAMHYRITLVQFDYDVHSVSKYRRGDWRTIKILGRGGTSFKIPLDYIEENSLVGKMNILLTDGYAPNPGPRDYPLVFVVVGKEMEEILKSQGFPGAVIGINHPGIS